MVAVLGPYEALPYYIHIYIHPEVKVKVTLRLTVGQSVCLGVEPQLGLMTRYLLLSDSYGLVFVALSLTKGRICLLYMLLPSPAYSFSGPSPLDLATIFYCLSFETSLFVASYDSHGHGGGIRPRLHTGLYTRVALYNLAVDRTENPVVLLRQEYRAVDKSRDFQPVFLECDVMRLRANVFT
jgi:hypothetical protein